VSTGLEQLLQILHAAEVKFVLIGGLAAIAHGAETVTGDVDICYARDRDNLERLVQALAPVHPRLRGVPPDLPFRLDFPTLRAGLNFTLTTDLADLDLLGEVLGLGGYDAVYAASEEIEMSGFRYSVITLEGLIRAKRAAGRPKDLRALYELEALLALRRGSEKKEEKES
jgi:predicted nucleotidyltransferase